MQASLQPNALRLRADGLTWREVDGKIVLLDLRTKTYLSINGTGVLLWKQIVDGTTTEELTGLVIQHYAGVDPETAKADVSMFVESLATQGLLE